MKVQNIKILLMSLMLLLLATSCENQPFEFEDYGVTTCYFPYQSPVRTIILGKYDEGFNENDNLHQFEIGVLLTGVYKNKVNRKVYFKLDTTLMNNVANVKYLPSTHYTIETPSPVIIPEGDTKGRILIKLTDAFFNDPKAVSSFYVMGTDPVINYAVPLLITGVEGIDSVLVGKAFVQNAVRNTADWTILPRDFTMYGIKYINKYHGNYLRRGVDKLINSLTDVEVGTKVYRNIYVERSELVKATTFDLSTITVPGIIRRATLADGGTLALKLQFAADGTCSVVNTANNAVIGTGSFKENGDKWGGKPRDVIYLNYAYTDVPRNEKHEVKDTMVIRDRAIGFESYVPVLKP